MSRPVAEEPAKADGAQSGGRDRVGLWRDIAGLMVEFWRSHPAASLGMLALLAVGGATSGSYMLVLRGLINALTEPGAPAGAVLMWLWLFMATATVEIGTNGLQPILTAFLRDHGVHRIQRRVLVRATEAPLVQFDESAFFDHLQRATSGMGERVVELYQRITQFVRQLFSLCSIAASLAFVHPILLPLLVLGSIPALWFQARVATAVYRVQRAFTTRDRLRGHLEGLLTGRDAAAEVRLFNTADYLLGRWQRLRSERQAAMVGAERHRALHTTAGDLIAGLAYAAALVFVARLILHGQLSIGDYVAVAQSALWFQNGLGDLVLGTGWLEEQSQFLGDLFDFWRVARREGDGAAPAGSGAVAEPDAPAAGPGGRGARLEAEAVTFAYPGTSQPVVREVSLRIEPGERIAIVGENGAGKSTLVKLLVGLYQPTAGVVRLNGVVLSGAGALVARSRIAAVFQDYAAYQLTARENIGFGNLALMDDDAALGRAAQRAGAVELLQRLPQGYDGYLGRQFGETELSGGQWQRIALARAFLRDADLLVLDEPTAALDPKAELELFERFVELVRGRTAIMISHRLGAARLADRVVVLRDGRIVEVGHHDELVGAGGEYAALFAAQAQWYR